MTLRGRRRLPMRAAALALAASTGACSMFNPYRHVDIVRSDKPGEDGVAKARATAIRELGFDSGSTLAGGAYEALIEIDRGREALYGDMKGVAVTRSLAATVGVVSSVWGVFSMLRPLPDGAAAMSIADRTHTARLAAVAAGSYGLHQYFVNPSQENVYARGYAALTCLAAQARPLLMSAAGDAAGAKGSRDELRQALDALETRLAQTSQRVEMMAAGVARAGDLGVSTSADNNPSARDVGNARRALERARFTLSDGQALLDEVDRVGYTLRARQGLIMAAVNLEVQAHVRPVDATAIMTDAMSISNSFKNIGKESTAETPAEQASMTGVGNELRAAAAAIAPPHIVAEHPMPSLSPVNVQVVSDAPARGGVRQVAAAPRQRSSLHLVAERTPVIPAAAASGAKEAKEAKDAKNAVEKQIKTLTSERDEARKAKDKVEAEMKALVNRVGTCMPDPVHPGQCSRTGLAIDVERLYQARRPVLNKLISFRQMTRAVRSIEDCNAGVVGVRISPDGDQPVKPGDELTFYVQLSNGQPATVGLHGSGAKMTTETIGAVTKASIKIDADAKEAVVVLRGLDLRTGVSEEVKMAIKPPPEPTPKQAAAAAAAAATKAASAAETAAQAASAAAKAATQ